MMKITVSLIVVVLVALLKVATVAYSVSVVDEGLLIVTTFPSLVNDIKQLVTQSDHVVSLVPIGVDPHEYQLTVGDVELLRRADVIVSTGHTPFEKRIRELVEVGELSAVLIEIPRIKGIEILNNPMTGLPNLHMPIYDPLNYIIFIDNVTRTLQKLKPENADIYDSKRLSIILNISRLLARTPRIYLEAVADIPPTQYAVSWLGVKVKYFLVREHGIPVTPSDLEVIRDEIARKHIKLAIVTKPATTISKQLIELANEYNIPILYVSSPLSSTSILEKLNDIARQVTSLTKHYTTSYRELHSVEGGRVVSYGYTIIGVIAVISIAILIAYMVLRGRRTV